MDKISLGTPTTEENKVEVSLDAPEVAPTIEPKTLMEKANRIKFSLGADGPALEQITQDLYNRQEQRLREDAAAKESSKINDARVSVVNEIVKKAAEEGRRVSPEETLAITDMTDADMISAAVDPETVFEKKYARNMLDIATTFEKDNAFLQSIGANPEGALLQKKHFEDGLSKQQIAKRLNDEQEQNYQSQTWLGWSVDQAKAVFPGYLWYKWNSVNKADVDGILPGTEKKALYTSLFSLPPEDMYREAKAIRDRLQADNPSLAREFTQGLLGYTTSDQFYDNLLIAGIDLTTLGVVAPVRAGVRAGKAVGAAGIAAAKETGTFVAEQVAAKGGTTAATKAVAEKAKEVMQDSARSMADFVSALSRPKADMADGMAALGQNNIAGLTAFFKSSTPGVYDGWEKMMKTVPSIFNIAETTSGAGQYLARKSVENIEVLMRDTADSLVKRILQDPIKMDRLDPVLLRAAAEEVKDRMSRTIGSAQNAILNVRVIDLERNAPGNTRFAAVTIGDTTGEAFGTKIEAWMTAVKEYGLKRGEFTTDRAPGNKWVINTKTSIDETSPIYEAGLKEFVTNNPTPLGNRFAQFVTRLRTPDDTLPKDIVEAFNNIGYGMAGAKAVVADVFQRVGSLKLTQDQLDEYDAFTRMLQQRVSRNDPSKMGDSPRNLLELEQDWFNKFGKPITEGQAALHMTMQQMNDFVYAGANIQQWMIRNREGYSNWSFSPKADMDLNDLEGKVITKLPEGLNANPGIMIIKEGEDGRIEDVLVTGYLNRFNRPKNEVPKPEPKNPDKPTKKELQALLDWEKGKKDIPSWNKQIEDLQTQGYKLVQLSQLGTSKVKQLHGLKAALKEQPDVSFILAKTTEQRMLDPNIIPYTDGFRFMPNPNSAYLRQGVFGINERNATGRYYGDRTIYQMNSLKEATEFAKEMNQARKLFLKGAETNDFTLFKDFVRANMPGKIGRHLMQDFKKGLKGDNEGIDPRIPIVATNVNQSVDNAAKLDELLLEGLGKQYQIIRNKDVSLGGYENNANMAATLERGDNVYRITNSGSAEKPLYIRDTPDLISARDAVEVMASSYMKSQFTDDVKFQAAERFIQEFSGILDPDKVRLTRDPIMMLLDEKVFKEGLQGDDAIKLAQARNFQERTKAFLGLRGDEQKEFDFWINKHLKDISEKFGNPKSLAAILDEYNKGKNPATVLRNFAFHSKLGMFSPRQLFLQPMTMVSMAAKVGFKNGGEIVRMTGNALWHAGVVWDRDLTKLLPETEKQLAKSGWKPGWFTEAYDLYRRSGIGEVKHSNIYLSDHLEFSMAKTKAGNFFFEKGLMFFNAGEMMNRKAATMGAYLEWRTANPLGKLTEKTATTIMKRADLLNQNMGHQSRASWQEGIKSVPTQFMGYTIRGMEQMWGKRLSKEEKVRVLLTHAAAFGVPISAAGATGFIPLNDMYAEGALAAGIDVNSNIFGTVFSDGVLGLAAEIMAGESTNISDRYGPGATPFIRDALFRNESFLEVISGPGGQTFGGLMMEVAPVVPWMWDFLKGDATIRPKAAYDIIEGQVTSLGQAEKAMAALFLGAYYSKRGKDLLDTDRQALQGMFEATLGFDPKRIDSIYKMENIMRRKADVQRKLTPSMKEDIRSVLRSSNPEDAEKTLELFKVKGIAAGFTEDQMERMIKEEVKGKTRKETTLNRFEEMSPETNIFVKEMLKKQAPELEVAK